MNEPALFELGTVDGDPHATFYRVTALALLGDGGLVVGDGASASLRVFGPDGTFEGEMGGEGRGPGEFRYLGSIHALPGDTLLVYDPVAYRLTIFRRSGELLSTVQIAPLGGAPEGYLGRDNSGRHLLSSIKPASRSPNHITADVIDVRRYDRDGQMFDLLGTFPGIRRVRSPVPFSPHLLGAVLGGRVIVTDGLLAALTMFADADSSTVAVDGAPARLSTEQAWHDLERGVQDSATTARLAMARNQPAWDSVPVFADMVTAPTAVWLKRYAPGTDSHWVARVLTGGDWFVIDLNGDVVASITMPEKFRLMAVGRARVAGVVKDALGVERIRVYGLPRRRPL